MQTESASRTAQLVAAYRGRVFEAGGALARDRWANALAGDSGRSDALKLDLANPAMELWVGVRTAHLDDRVTALSATAPQVVVLGAGLDTRAARLATHGVRFFEVDHPDTQALKLERLRALAGYPIDAGTYAPCDFERDDFVEALARAGFQRDVPAVVLWEGVVYYLTESAVRGTLRRLSSTLAAGSTLIFDFLGRRVVEGRTRQENDKQVRELVAGFGEPLLFGIDDPLPLLFEEGFRRVDVKSFDELALSYTGTYERSRRFRFQSVAEAGVV